MRLLLLTTKSEGLCCWTAFVLQNSSMVPRSMVAVLDFEEIFLFFHPMTYKCTASGEKRKKIPKYDTDQCRSSEYITPYLHSDLSRSELFLVVCVTCYIFNCFLPTKEKDERKNSLLYKQKRPRYRDAH